MKEQQKEYQNKIEKRQEEAFLKNAERMRLGRQNQCHNKNQKE